MLNPTDLGEYITNSIRTIVCPAIKQCILNSWPEKSDKGDEIAESFANEFDSLVSEELGNAIAQAIDYYIKQIELYGTVITTGTPTTQTAQINGMSVPMINGAVPNTLGVR